MAADLEAVKQLVENYASDVRNIFPVDRVVLFGSHAKGTATAESDIDVCFFLSSFGDMRRVDIIKELLGLMRKYKRFIQQEIQNGRFGLLWSYVLEYENSKNPFEVRHDSIIGWKEIAAKHIEETEDIITFGESLIKRGLKLYDALHVACAYYGGCDRFITVDKRILNSQINEIIIKNPIDFIRELEN
jgi:predicted nucleotidyltransferase